SWIEMVGRFMPVGFYYKTFYKRGSWKFWEPIIRSKAGLGRVDVSAHHGYYDKEYLFADVAVIGGGPAGLSAALEAARAGGEVILIDDWPILGGSLAYARFDGEGHRAEAQLQELIAQLRAMPNLRVMDATTCTGWFADNWLALVRGNRFYKLRAKATVMATGSLEQPAVFRNNDLPGVMMGSAAQRLIRLYGVRPGRKAVVLTANAEGYAVALDLVDAGVTVQAVVDLRPRTGFSAVEGAVQRLGLPVFAGH